MLSIYVVLVLFFEAVLLNGTSESLSDGFKQGAEKAEISAKGIFGSLPLIIFSYMYQVNVPQIYQELEVKTLANAKKVIILGTILAAVAYMVGGIFGYIAFSNSDPADLDKWFSDNILSAPY